MLITFSGLDGSGKSTLIAKLVEALQSKGHRVATRTMYYDISFYSFIRRIRDQIKIWLRIPIANGKPATIHLGGINPHDPKIDASDKKGKLAKIVYRMIRSQMTRKIFLCCDLLILIAYRFKEEFLHRRILITDRYLYDSLVDVADLKGRKWFLIRLFLLISPRPLVPIFVDVSAEDAFARKGEYPVEYMKWRRNAYHQLFRMVERPVILTNDNLNTTVKNLLEAVLGRICQNSYAP